MRKLLVVILLTVSLSSYSQTQEDRNATARAEYEESDALLNTIYKNIQSMYSTDTLFVRNLKQSQRIWIQFRDAELEMKFPKRKPGHYGSALEACKADYMRQLTDQRIGTLKQWLGGSEEGDPCSGSVRILQPIDPQYRQKAYITKKGQVGLVANMHRDHRIFGYEEKDIHSKKLLLLSIFTNEVEHNPFDCKYGAYYQTSSMEGLELRYLSSEDEFLKMALISAGRTIATLYMLAECFEFTEY